MKKMSSIPAIAAVCMMALSFMLEPLYSFAADIDTIPLTDVKITPSTLNLKSRGTFITSHIALPDPYATELPQPDDVTLRLLIGDNETGEIGALRAGSCCHPGLIARTHRASQPAIVGTVLGMPEGQAFSHAIGKHFELRSRTGRCIRG